MSSLAEDITNINFGDISPKLSLHKNSVIAEKEITLPIGERTSNSINSSVHWTVLGPLLKQDINRKKYFFQTNVPGVGVEVGMERFNAQHYPVISVKLIKTEKTIGSGAISSGQPLMKWNMVSNDKNEVEKIKSGVFFISGNIHYGTCTPTRGDVFVDMQPISVDTLKNLNIGEKLHSLSQRQNISINCTPGISDAFSIRFYGEHNKNTPHILDGGNGVGFIAELLKENNTVTWNGLQSYEGYIPEYGRVDIPLTIYYTKVSNNVQGGRVHAKGIFTISYR